MSGGLPRALRQQLESLARAGVQELPRPRPASLVLPSKVVASAAAAAHPHSSSPPPAPPLRSTAVPAAPVSQNPVAPPLDQTRPAPSRTFRIDDAHGNPPASRQRVPDESPQPEGPTMPKAAKSKSPAEPQSAPSSSSAGEPVRRTAAQKRTALAQLCDEVKNCTLCPALVANRTQTVFGVGNVQTRLCFFGEAPGADEDRQGEPFVGRAGQLLDKIIEACSLRREDVYILNTLKCRPPNNRPPEPDEMENCRPYFERQLEIIRPEFICCLGRSAATAMFGSKPTLGDLRRRVHTWRWARVVVTYHPAYLLRNPAAKKDAWEDMQMLMREMGIEIRK